MSQNSCCSRLPVAVQLNFHDVNILHTKIWINQINSIYAPAIIWILVVLSQRQVLIHALADYFHLFQSSGHVTGSYFRLFYFIMETWLDLKVLDKICSLGMTVSQAKLLYSQKYVVICAVYWHQTAFCPIITLSQSWKTHNVSWCLQNSCRIKELKQN